MQRNCPIGQLVPSLMVLFQQLNVFLSETVTVLNCAWTQTQGAFYFFYQRKRGDSSCKVNNLFTDLLFTQLQFLERFYIFFLLEIKLKLLQLHHSGWQQTFFCFVLVFCFYKIEQMLHFDLYSFYICPDVMFIIF